jgi:hypothetical protein
LNKKGQTVPAQPDPGTTAPTTPPPTTTASAPDGICPPDAPADAWDPSSPNHDPDCPPPLVDPTSCQFGFVFDEEANNGEGDCVPCPEDPDDPLFDPDNCAASDDTTELTQGGGVTSVDECPDSTNYGVVDGGCELKDDAGDQSFEAEAELEEEDD